jgi:hypothetical protein
MPDHLGGKSAPTKSFGNGITDMPTPF